MIRTCSAALVAVACLGFTASAMGAEGGVDAVNKALAASKSSGKPLLMVAGAEWCGPCKMLEKLMKENDQVKAVANRYIYHHIDVDHDKAAWAMWTKKYSTPGNGIPTIYIVKPDGELAHSQCGVALQPAAIVSFFSKYAKEAAKAVLSPKTLGLMKTAAKKAEEMLENGRFVSAYETLGEFSEELKEDNKLLTKIKATMKKIEEAAIEKIGSAKELVQTAKSEGKRLDGAYQLAIIAGNMADCETVAEKAQSTIDALKKDSKNADLFKQAKLLYEAKEAAREEDAPKAKKLYEKLIADYKDTEAAKRAKAKLDELAGGS